MPQKGTILGDTFEQLAELGQSTAKKTVKSVAQTFNPLAQFEKSNMGPDQKAMLEKLKNKKDNHTPLDFKKLQAQYDKNDTKQTDALRRHLFGLVKRSDERMLMEKRQTEMQKKRQGAYAEADKKKKEEEKKRSMSQGDGMPKGKQRRSIFSKKKVAQEQHTETKPATGKQ